MDIEHLIECVRRHEFLYNVDHKEYKNIYLKTSVWESIAKELNQNSEWVKTKWKTLRDGYTKYRKQIKSEAGSSKKSNRYLWSAQLSFLEAFNFPKATHSNISYTQSSAYLQDSDNSEDVKRPQSSLDASQFPLPLMSSNVASSTTDPLTGLSCEEVSQLARGTKRRYQGNGDKNLQRLDPKKKRLHDGIDHLFLSYADAFKKFPLRDQVHLKLELAKLFANAELRLLQNATAAQPQFNFMY